MLLLIGGLTNAQTIKRSKQKTEQTQKSNTTKSNKTTSKSTKAEKQKSNSSTSAKGKATQKREKEKPSDDLSISSSRSNSGSTSSQSTESTARPTAPTTYDVKFSCNVPNADMYVNGEYYGHPNRTRTLEKGRYQVKLIAADYEDYINTIYVTESNNSFNFIMSRKAPKVETFTVKGISFDMIFVEGGTYTMGATREQGGDANSNEKPAHQVTLSGFYIGKYEVTQELWKAVMGKKPSKFKNNPKNPVENVSWQDCQKFMEKLNKLTGKHFRLPTEAEWEYAARGGKWSMGYKYAGSNNLNDVAWYSKNSGGMTHPVGMKAPNELGLFDMSGNVYEWCQDCDGSYRSGPQTNPINPCLYYLCVWRGGAYYIHDWWCRVSCRGSARPDAKTDSFGLRLAL